MASNATWSAARTRARSPTPTPGRSAPRAVERGHRQVGSLGSGNHFLEVQVVERSTTRTPHAFGLAPGRVCVMIHCGSRGLGHQICTDHVRDDGPGHGPLRHHRARPAAGLRARGLAGGPRLPGRDGRRRQLRAGQPAAARRARPAGLRRGLPAPASTSSTTSRTTWPSSRTHEVDGARRLLCVHRKGATRALPPGHPDLPAYLRRGGPAGAGARHDGDGVVRARGRAGLAGVQLHLPRRGPGA